jgi:hypothetical protein
LSAKSSAAQLIYHRWNGLFGDQWCIFKTTTEVWKNLAIFTLSAHSSANKFNSARTIDAGEESLQ